MGIAMFQRLWRKSIQRLFVNHHYLMSESLKRDAGRASLNKKGKTALAIFSVGNKQIWVNCMLWLDNAVMKP